LFTLKFKAEIASNILSEQEIVAMTRIQELRNKFKKKQLKISNRTKKLVSKTKYSVIQEEESEDGDFDAEQDKVVHDFEMNANLVQSTSSSESEDEIIVSFSG
jgi:hypothetical protein